MWHFTSHPFVIKKNYDVSFRFIWQRTSTRTSSKKELNGWHLTTAAVCIFIITYEKIKVILMIYYIFFLKSLCMYCTFGHVTVSHTYVHLFIYIIFTYVRTLNTTIRTKQITTIHYIQRLVYMTCYLTTVLVL